MYESGNAGEAAEGGQRRTPKRPDRMQAPLMSAGEIERAVESVVEAASGMALADAVGKAGRRGVVYVAREGKLEAVVLSAKRYRELVPDSR